MATSKSENSVTKFFQCKENMPAWTQIILINTMEKVNSYPLVNEKMYVCGV
jgi:hypothetical protein